jgi:hypothetical protein
MGKKVNSRTESSRLPFFLSLGVMGIFFIFTALLVVIIKGGQGFCANSVSCIEDLKGTKEAEDEGVFMNKTVYAPDLKEKIPEVQSGKTVLAAQSGDHKRIYVDLTNQRLYAFEGDNLVMNFLVSTGKWYPTPTGDFRVWVWLRYTRMAGGSGAGYYNLPNVPFTMYISNGTIPKERGYAIHGAYWHDNFGHPMSHGCVNLRTEDAEKLFYWTNSNAGSVSYAQNNQGTLVTIYGRTPRE